ncbi:hypothetical protein GCM10009769_01300 [Curtobacterium luteum]|uniref:Transcription factor zinc-finger domain-containing protein n=2 Tax=Curtobacterium luteum TaxID=33881 RepID=A0A8H9G7V8_9MICO|nr:hypothetical protein GCM10009769_01300 [Curtobacterium luteum]
MSPVGDGRDRRPHDDEELLMMHDGWCPDCDLRSVVIDVDDAGEHAWATCSECGAGWVHRDELPESAAAAPSTTERRAA